MGSAPVTAGYRLRWVGCNFKISGLGHPTGCTRTRLFTVRLRESSHTLAVSYRIMPLNSAATAALNDHCCYCCSPGWRLASTPCWTA
jgi:hypothetical protein